MRVRVAHRPAPQFLFIYESDVPAQYQRSLHRGGKDIFIARAAGPSAIDRDLMMKVPLVERLPYHMSKYCTSSRPATVVVIGLYMYRIDLYSVRAVIYAC